MLEFECLAFGFQRDLLACHREQPAAQTATPFQRRFQQQLHFLTYCLGKLGGGEQRPIETGRGNLQHIVPGNRILDVEQRGQLAAGRLAVLDADLAAFRGIVGALFRASLLRQIQIHPQRTLPVRRGEFHANAFQPQIGQNFGKSLCECLGIHGSAHLRSPETKNGLQRPISLSRRCTAAYHSRPPRRLPVGHDASLRPTKKPHEEAFLHQERSGSGGRIRTCDLRVMSPTSCQTAPPRIRFRGV